MSLNPLTDPDRGTTLVQSAVGTGLLLGLLTSDNLLKQSSGYGSCYTA